MSTQSVSASIRGSAAISWGAEEFKEQFFSLLEGVDEERANSRIQRLLSDIWKAGGQVLSTTKIGGRLGQSWPALKRADGALMQTGSAGCAGGGFAIGMQTLEMYLEQQLRFFTISVRACAFEVVKKITQKRPLEGEGSESAPAVPAPPLRPTAPPRESVNIADFMASLSSLFPGGISVAGGSGVLKPSDLPVSSFATGEKVNSLRDEELIGSTYYRLNDGRRVLVTGSPLYTILAADSPVVKILPRDSDGMGAFGLFDHGGGRISDVPFKEPISHTLYIQAASIDAWRSECQSIPLVDK